MEDFCDGDAFCSSTLYSTHTKGLQIFLYFDEVEICNPLGSKATIHKLGIVLMYMCSKHLICFPITFIIVQ